MGARAHPLGLVRAAVQERAAAAAAAALGAASRRGRPKLFLLLWREPHVQPVLLQVALHLQAPPPRDSASPSPTPPFLRHSVPWLSTLQRERLEAESSTVDVCGCSASCSLECAETTAHPPGKMQRRHWRGAHMEYGEVRDVHELQHALGGGDLGPAQLVSGSAEAAVQLRRPTDPSPCPVTHHAAARVVPWLQAMQGLQCPHKAGPL